MMKHLKIEVNGQEWVNGEFSEVTFTDGPTGVRIEAKAAAAPRATGGGASILEMFANASRARTQAVAEERRAELADAEVVEAEPAERP